ncbi:hypothetical protein [Psychrobacter aquimaris]|uniref:hypothetical protein n=1 Tax=Psychrobacter aquimaris TaxID=292733 RepID=UPI0039C6B4AA
MKGKYYTTADIKEIFGWESNTTVSRKRDSGFLPAPDLAGRPNKWLKVTIDSIVNGTNMASKEEGLS